MKYALGNAQPWQALEELTWDIPRGSRGSTRPLGVPAMTRMGHVRPPVMSFAILLLAHLVHMALAPILFAAPPVSATVG